jgi:LacI family transcriptional regulator
VGTVTIQEVAAYAGVSRATVSRALNGHPGVSPELRDRVLEAARVLGYQPNRFARRLRIGSNVSDVVGLIISDIENPFFISVVRGVEDVAYANRLSVVLCNTDENPDKQQMYLSVMMAERVGGLIISPAPVSDYQELDRLRQQNIPIILLDRCADGFEFDTVRVDNVQGSFMAVSHLLEQGYTRIALIGGTADLTTARERHEGYQKALEAAGIPLDKTLVKHGDYKKESGYRLARDLMSLREPPQAIFAANNLMTLGTLQALQEMQVRIPQDVALVGFDDMPWSGQLCPPLTAVAQPTYDLGREAGRLLLRRMHDHDAANQSIVLQTRLIVRESSGVNLIRTVRNDRDDVSPA